MEPRVKERVAAGRAHGAQVTEQLDEQEVALVDQVNVNVSQHVEHVNGEPAQCKGRDQERHQAEDLPLPSPLGACLVLAPVARCHTLPQFDGYTEVRHEDSREREDVCYQQGAVRVRAPFFLLTQPEFLTDGEPFILELHVVGVQDCRAHEATGEQPDAD